MEGHIDPFIIQFYVIPLFLTLLWLTRTTMFVMFWAMVEMLWCAGYSCCSLTFTPVHHEEKAPPPCHQLPAAYPLLSEPGPLVFLHLWSPMREVGLQGHRPSSHLCSDAHPQWDPAGHVQQDPPHRFTPPPGAPFQRCPVLASYSSRVSVSCSSQPPTASWFLDWCCWVFWKPYLSRTSWTKIRRCRGNSGSRRKRRSAMASRRQVSRHS